MKEHQTGVCQSSAREPNELDGGNSYILPDNFTG